MQAAAELAGFFAAHAVWCVADGETLIPILAFIASDGTRHMQRLEDPRLEDAVDRGKKWLAENPATVAAAALVYDGYVTLATGRTDALIADVRSYSEAATSSLRVVVPYRHANSGEGFAVYRPKFLNYEGPAFAEQQLDEAFWSGVDNHEKGAAVWNAHLDQSR
jgi:hypothetical protein